MSKDDFEKMEQILLLRTKIVKAEQERISGLKTLSIAEVRKRLASLN